MPTQAATYVEAIRHMPAGSTLIIPDVSWAEYEQLLADLGDGYAVRLTYDQGRLEIMSPSSRHGKYAAFVERVAHVLATELKLNLDSFGSTTFKELALKQGAEPDTCFYVQHAAQVVGRMDLDLAVDPPPDVVLRQARCARSLAIRRATCLDISPQRNGIHRSLGQPCVSRVDG